MIFDGVLGNDHQVAEIPKQKDFNITCISDEGYKVFQICQGSIKDWETLFRGYFKDISEFGYIQDWDKEQKENKEEDCRPPTYLLAIDYLLEVKDIDDFLLYLWEPLQLRYNYWRKHSSNYHLPGGYNLGKNFSLVN